jgi:hypothetical protein
MPSLKRIFGLAAVMLMTMTARAYAHDIGAPHDDRHGSVAALLGYGFDFNGDDDLNPFGLGVGVRGGYTLDSGVYLGGQFVFFGGDSATVLAVKRTANIVTLGLEAGYDFWVDPVIVRPSLGMGVAFTNESVGGVDSDYSSVYFAPGATVIYPIGQFFVGGDARLWLVTGDTRTGLSILATGGITF